MLGFLSSLGEQVVDAEEESFLLFTRDIPSANLGFIDARASVVDVTLHGQELAIHQSPTLLSSRREGGTTGAVLWKITPRFAEWIAAPTTKNPFFAASILTPSATVVELGCGISGLVALALAPRIGHYIATDQEYVRKIFKQNIDENVHNQQQQQQPKKRKSKAGNSTSTTTSATSNITFTPLDWEVDNPSTLKQTIPSTTTTSSSDKSDPGFDLVISCDCIYNEALVPAFVRTCADICRLRPKTHPTNSDDQSGSAGKRPTICVVAQQQRSPDVFETWLRETLRVFDVWRLSDDVLGEGLRDGTGYVVHALALKASSY